MGLDVPDFEFEYAPTRIAYGRGCIGSIGAKLADDGHERALVICGSNVGTNEALMEPLRDGLGDRLAGVFDETTPAKTLEIAIDGAERVRAEDVDAVVGLGGGSSLDVAKATCVLGVQDLPRADVLSETEATGTVPTPGPDTAPIPLYVVPTTLAGADMTASGGITLGSVETESIREAAERGSASTADPRLLPEVLFYDPDLFATTPTGVLTGSAMNGFDKAVETLYSRSTNPVADAHALHALRFLRTGLRGLADAGAGDDALHRSIVGMILAQYTCQPNVIHAFGNGVSGHFDVQQGDVHGMVAPSVLRWVFEAGDGRRRLLAEGLGVDHDDSDDEAVAELVIEEVAAIRDALGLPSQLRSVAGLTPDDLPDIAAITAENFHFSMAPPSIEPDRDEIESVLRSAW